jgi:hypothetical protein
MADRDWQISSARSARQWLGLSLIVLILAGLFALAVVIGRMPPLDRYVTDPLFFKRCLVAHVNLALVAWFYSFVAALLFLLPHRGRSGPVARRSVYVAGIGVVMLLVGAALPEGRPLLANYIPTIDHWLFQLGQVVFGLGVLASILDPRLLPSREASDGFFELPDAARPGLRAIAAAFVLAAFTFLVAGLNQTAGLDGETYYELLVWGGGHVLQLVCTVAMLTVWIILLGSALGRSPLSRPAASFLFLALLLPWFITPLLALQGTWSSAYNVGSTNLMQWGLFPVVTIFALLCCHALYRAWSEGRLDARGLADVRISAFLVSAVLTGVGFGLGAAIRGSTTMVPAHYHASVGAVTVAFMAGAYLILAALGATLPARIRRAAAWQPALYGTGMLVFASGFALAGAYGMGRKVYGAEQAARGMAETVGLGLMSLGGFVAIAGGLLFLVVIAAVWWRGGEADAQTRTRLVASSWRWRHGVQRPG